MLISAMEIDMSPEQVRYFVLTCVMFHALVDFMAEWNKRPRNEYKKWYAKFLWILLFFCWIFVQAGPVFYYGSDLFDLYPAKSAQCAPWLGDALLIKAAKPAQQQTRSYHQNGPRNTRRHWRSAHTAAIRVRILRIGAVK